MADGAGATPARSGDAVQAMVWESDAQALLNEFVQTEPVLVQISAAKRLRDRAERDAKSAGADRVTADIVRRARYATQQGALT